MISRWRKKARSAGRWHTSRVPIRGGQIRAVFNKIHCPFQLLCILLVCGDLHLLRPFVFFCSVRFSLKLPLKRRSGTPQPRDLASSRRFDSAGRFIAAEGWGAIKVTKALEGSSLRISLSVEQAELARLLDRALASPAGQKLHALAAAARKPGTITIQGSGTGAQQLGGSSQSITVPANSSRPMNGISIQGGSQRSSALR